jgi:hypothetical protein
MAPEEGSPAAVVSRRRELRPLWAGNLKTYMTGVLR